MLRIILLLIALLPLKLCLAQPVNPPTLGDGSAGNPYQIATLGNLNWIADDATRWAFHYIQTSNINAAGTSLWYAGTGWRPIGNTATCFTGTYDGQGFNISGLTINRNANYQGLFGATDLPAELLNINLLNVNITSAGYTGGLVGFANRTIITNCNVSGTVTCPGDRVGGLVGFAQLCALTNDSTDVIVRGRTSVGGLVGYANRNQDNSDCVAIGDVIGTGNEIGGLVGYNIRSSTFVNNTARGNVSGASSVGGLIGKNEDNAHIENSEAEGDVTGSADMVGGLIGLNQTWCNVSNSSADGNVQGRNFVGGLNGVNSNNCNITNCHTTSLTVNGLGSVGGLIGYNLTDCLVSNSTATPRVTATAATSRAGGLIGYNLTDATSLYAPHTAKQLATGTAQADSLEKTITVLSPTAEPLAM